MRLADGLVYGGDYNPEQWTRDTWVEDVALMRVAGVNLVTLGVFSWGLIETADNVFDLGWLDEVVGLLHENGIGIDLATPTAAPPSWLHTAHPEILPFDADLYQQPPGGRNAWCPSSPVFRAYALRIAERLARRYGDHPAVRLWHVGNELGGGNARCYCDVSAVAFREWLAQRHGTVEAVNQAWGTTFWGHRFNSFEEILPPRGKHGAPNPGLFLDYERYSSDALLAHYRAEREVIQQFSDRPVTTNLMVGPGAQIVDYARWAPHTDIVANDHYTLVDDPDRAIELACSGDRMRGMSPGRRPWLLMEHSTGGPSWQQRNRAKDPGEIARNALAHVARGSDGAMFFQWRASTAGAEQFHSAMLPHAGTRSRVWQEVVELGGHLRSLAEVAGSRVEPARVAMVVDDESGWYLQHGLKPHRGLRYGDELRAWHKALWQRQVLVDLVPATGPQSDLASYDLVLVPGLILVDDEVAARLSAVPARGGTLLVTYLSGVCDPTGRVRTGGYPGAFRDVLGIFTDEFYPLQTSQEVPLDDGGVVRDWTERVQLDGASAVISYAGSSLAGGPAVTRRAVGEGAAWYVSAALPGSSIDAITARLITETGLTRTVQAPAGLEAVRRIGDDASYLFLINHLDTDVEVAAGGLDLLTDEKVGPSTLVPAGGVRVVRESSVRDHAKPPR
ncbi:beta-galactosidase [Kineosporia sp. NBRC 101731]|uniref:beta-galactosidase n=1 Tax=Kineosporia sp. NBRC 101731 TaxID=3032199 RepID=UPI0024A0B565|nr:beta-galactosidase [Kineosporia sp. NBRC 101731]GLY30909.1 beta-galactosidase [Kineosporia sp. NBRC 101731]